MKESRLKRFWTYLRPHRRSIALLFASILVTILIQLPTPWLEKVIIDDALPRGDTRKLLVLVGVIAGLFASYRLVIFLRSYLSVRIKQRVLTSVRMSMYEHLQRMSQRFFGRHSSGELLSRVTNDVGYVQNLMNDQLFEVIASAIKVVVVLGLLLYINVRLTLLCLAVMPVIGGLFLLFKRRVYLRNRELQESHARLSGRIQQSFAGMKLIQAEVIEEPMRAETLAASRELEQVGVRREMVSVTGNLLTTVLSYVPIICILWGVGGVMVVRGTLTLGELLAYTQYLLGLVAPVTGFFQFNMNLQAGYAALDRIYEVLDEEPEIRDRPDAEPLAQPIESLAFENVSLRYTAAGEGEDEPRVGEALRDVSFELRRGERVAVVGPSGSGKTSLINVLLRFYEPTAGDIRINGRSHRDYTLESLRRAVAYVSQEVFLFSTSVRDNVTLGRDATDAQVEEALRNAAADDFVAGLEGGADAALDQLGANLSGGQRQRIALARALGKDASLLVLDEATSALDTASEQRVLTNLRILLAGRTALIIAHRFSFLELVDRILVFADGRLVEDGTLEELLERRGLFYTLHQTQVSQSGDSEQ
ncbi:MAG: ABC transporter ATP-binding protein [bacterium]